MIEKKIQNIFNRISPNVKTQTILQGFYKEFFTWSAQNLGCWIVAAILLGIFGIFMIIPYVLIAEDIKEIAVYIFLFVPWGTLSYMQPYVRFKEGDRMVSIYQKLKYFPVSRQDIRLFCLQKLLVFCVRMFLILLVLQLVFTLIFFREISWGNIWYPFVFGFLFPFGVSGIWMWYTL